MLGVGEVQKHLGIGMKGSLLMIRGKTSLSK
jgi:hypothetical protein